MSLNEKTNLSWHFYKNYFVNANGSLMNLKKENLKSDATEKMFKKKNEEISIKAYDISYFKNYPNSFQLFCTYPGLLLGAGYGHEVSAKGELKLGFFFDYTTGLPIIPGSSVKGVLRSVFPDFKTVFDSNNNQTFKLKMEAIDKERIAWFMALVENIDKEKFLETYYEPKEINKITDNDIATYCKLTLEIFEGIKDITKTKATEKYYSIYERDIFHDAVIVEAGKNNCLLGDDYITPHHPQGLLKNPVPIPFLKVLPNVRFNFNIAAKNSLIVSSLTADKKHKLFQKILLTIGIGAKTNVGYGQFSIKDITTVNNTQQREILTEISAWKGNIPNKPNTFIKDVQAEIIEKKNNHQTIVKFILNDKEYKEICQTCPSTYEVGKLIAIKMSFNKKKEPTQISFDDKIFN
jgi:CRISPR-associated protein Cmr6